MIACLGYGSLPHLWGGIITSKYWWGYPFFPGRDRDCRHCWISFFWTPRENICCSLGMFKHVKKGALRQYLKKWLFIKDMLFVYLFTKKRLLQGCCYLCYDFRKRDDCFIKDSLFCIAVIIKSACGGYFLTSVMIFIKI